MRSRLTADPELTPEQLKFIQDHGSGVLTEKFYSWLTEVTAHHAAQVDEEGRRRADPDSEASESGPQRSRELTIVESRIARKR